MRALVAMGALLCALAWSGRADAFPWMIRHDYTACNTCHADPSGAGLLTAYGRGLAETVVRTRFGKKAEDEDPGTVGNFMFGAFKTPEQLLLQFDLRGMHLIGPVPVPTGSRIPYHYYFMQADLAAQLKVGRFRVNGSLGWAHEGAASAAITSGWTPSRPTEFCSAPPCDRLISRNYWIGVDIGSDEQFLLRAGRLNIPFGIRNVEHTMWVRKDTRTNINDFQSHGVALSWNQSGLRAELMAILGNYAIHGTPGSKWDAPHERGYAGYVEWAPKETLAVGVSSMATYVKQDVLFSTELWRQAHGLFARWSPAKPVVLSAESDFLFFSEAPTATAGAQNRGGNASVISVDLEPTQGVHAMFSSEFRSRYWGTADPACATLKPGSFCGTDFGLWAGAQWFFAPHFDVRADVNWQFIGGRDGTSILVQLHGYL